MNDARIQLLDTALFPALVERARRSPRLRTNHNFHGGMGENPHRFLNVMIRGTYIAPHRHLDPPKTEAFLILEGEVAFITFDDSGSIAGAHILGGSIMGIDVAPGVWHSVAVLSPHAVCYEVKPGPYSQATDKDFAPWAPHEGDPAAFAYLARLVAAATATRSSM
jgi:cupin fold WbuC family metalloprotein